MEPAAETSALVLYTGQLFYSLLQFNEAVADWTVKELYSARVVKSKKSAISRALARFLSGR
jgi:hypothetical protein